jgi:hypothetical protein
VSNYSHYNGSCDRRAVLFRLNSSNAPTDELTTVGLVLHHPCMMYNCTKSVRELVQLSLWPIGNLRKMFPMVRPTDWGRDRLTRVQSLSGVYGRGDTRSGLGSISQRDRSHVVRQVQQQGVICNILPHSHTIPKVINQALPRSVIDLRQRKYGHGEKA